jgi:hypothetical protein
MTRRKMRLSVSLTFCLLLFVTEPSSNIESVVSTRPDAGFQTQTSAQPVNVPKLPIVIDYISVADTSDGYALTCSASNQTDDQIVQLHAAVFALNEAGDVVYAGNKASSVEIAGHTTEKWVIELGFKEESNFRVFIMLYEIRGKAFRWKVIDADNALLKYARGEDYAFPKVLQMQN